MTLTKNTTLQRAPDLAIHLRAITEVDLVLNGESFRGNPFTLAVLDTFSTPKTVEAALEELRPRVRGERAWLDLTQHLTALYRWGVLQDPGQRKPLLGSHSDWFDAAPVHIRMLEDRAQTASYQRAIRETVTADDVVVDIGTGTGVLAVTAALANARHVYAVESSSMARLARETFAANHLSDRITLIEGRSTQIDLPEKADVLVSEVIGNDPLDEGILETTADAVSRLLKPDARLIPDRLSIYGLPVSVPPDWLETYLFTDQATAEWQSWYGIDFSPLAAATKEQSHSFSANTHETREWLRISEPVLLAEPDLRSVDYRKIETSAEVPATRSGELNGVIVFFETRLSPSVHFSIHPSKATPENSWASKVWVAGRPLAVEAGDTFRLTYSYGDRGSDFDIQPRTRSSNRA